ncbi:hypothetical protein [Prauserella muralis]|uniref:Uncharacterized protein n=1 Tax=Prauserella muralis TaxID=588067 RepID=A0A2V4ABR7_9PSEU|nr:hypothetical protein [Prauserella muralis]PXY16566.1 hypothetical protein BAY60_35810 [Prauserella muralis]TWE11194.1 hypothetical protein FHX69_7413 [Prauserella muralis]
MAWLLLIFTGVILILLHKQWPKWKKWYVVTFVTALVACSLASTSLGGWLAGLLAQLLGALFGWTGARPALVAALLVVIGILAVAYGLRDKKANTWEMCCLFMLPLLFIISSGPIAAGGGTFADAVTNFGSQGLGYLISG